MINLIIGRAGYGKSTVLCDMIKKEILEGDRQLVLLVPEQQTVLWETKMAKMLPTSSNLRLEITNFTRLSNSVFRECGGLADTIRAYNEYDGTGNGFSFKNYNAHEMMHVIEYAISMYCDHSKWINLVKNTMKVDFSWNVSAKRYIDIYNKIG
jgi:hypothetical protein